MYDRVLIPTDGSRIADRAGEFAIALAGGLDAELHIIGVADEGKAKRAENAIKDIATLAKDAELKHHTKVIESFDPIHQEILGYAEKHDIDAIVMGTHGRTGINRFIIGSVATQTLRNAKIPVITVHEETELDFAIDNILVPTDGSPSAEAAANHAIDIANATGATIHALHVGEDGDSPAHEAAELAKRRGVEDVVTVVRSGRPHLEIAGYISEEDCDIVVMGTHGRTGIRRYFIGSVTERTLRFSTVPVIAVRPRMTSTTIEYLDYEAIEGQGWSLDDDNLFEKAAAANLDRESYGTLGVEEGEYILDAAEAAGYKWPYYCRAGGCINCAGILIEGEVEMERCMSLSDEEVEDEHLRLTCVATPTSDTVKIVYNAKEIDLLKDRVI